MNCDESLLQRFRPKSPLLQTLATSCFVNHANNITGNDDSFDANIGPVGVVRTKCIQFFDADGQAFSSVLL